MNIASLCWLLQPIKMYCSEWFLHIKSTSFSEPKQISPTAAEKNVTLGILWNELPKVRKHLSTLNNYTRSLETVQYFSLLPVSVWRYSKFCGPVGRSAPIWLVSSTKYFPAGKKTHTKSHLSGKKDLENSLKRNIIKCLWDKNMDENFHLLYFCIFLQWKSPGNDD